jgi:hypothetical protein
MWRLKIAEGGNDPYLFSTNNFVGRQTWEYDSEAGTQEERSQVEQARLNFYNNRFKVKPCGDLLWRFQVSIIYSQPPFLLQLNLFSIFILNFIYFTTLFYNQLTNLYSSNSTSIFTNVNIIKLETFTFNFNPE